MEKIGIKLESHKFSQKDLKNNTFGNFLNKDLPEILKKKNKKNSVFWVGLDSTLLSQNLFNNSWKDFSNKNVIPLLSGIKFLADPRVNLCLFALSPSLEDMAYQALELGKKMLKEKVTPPTEPVISVNKFLNFKKAEEMGLNLDELNLDGVTVLK